MIPEANTEGFRRGTEDKELRGSDDVSGLFRK